MAAAAPLKELYDAIVNGEAQESEDLTRKALESGLDADSLLKQTLVPAMAEVGRLFEEGEFFVPELLVAAKAMKSSLTLLRPLLLAAAAQSGLSSKNTVIIGTVKGDIHDIGKNLVATMLEGAGFVVTDLGVDVSPDAFVAAVNKYNPALLCMSALLTTTMTGMRDVVAALEAAGVRDKVKVLIGGAPITSEYAQQIKADGYAPDASSATRVAKSLIA